MAQYMNIFEPGQPRREAAQAAQPDPIEVIPMGSIAGDAPTGGDAPVVIVDGSVEGAPDHLVHEALSADPDAWIVFLAKSYDYLEAEAVLACGARAYLPKDAPVETLVKALQLVASGCIVVGGRPDVTPSAALDRRLGSRDRRQAGGNRRRGAADRRSGQGDSSSAAAPARTAAAGADDSPSNAAPAPRAATRWSLSSREAAILRLITEGQSNKQIARRLGIAEATVKAHMKTILRKVGAKNRTQAAVWAFSEPHAAAPQPG